MAIETQIISPAAGPMGPDDAIVFRVIFDGLPDVLTADVTLPDGTVERVWDYDQAVNGYDGALEVDGDERTYSIRRPIGWPMGALALAVHAEGGEGGDTVIFDETFAGPDEGDTPDIIKEVTGLGLEDVPNGATIRVEVTPCVVDVPTIGYSGATVPALISRLGDPGAPDSASITGSPAGPALAAAEGSTEFVSGAGFPGSAAYVEYTHDGDEKSLYIVVEFDYVSEIPIHAALSDYGVKITHVGGGSGEDDATRTWTVVGVDTASSRLIIQYRESPKLNHVVNLHATLVEQIKNALNQVPPLDDPEQAGGVNLTVTAELVGQPRTMADGDVATDGQLRVLIGARITRNNARVTAADYLAALVNFFQERVVLTDHGGMSIKYTVMREPTDDEIAVLDQDIVARPMGVKVTRSWAPADYFGYAGDPNALGYGQGHYVEGF